MLLKRVEMVGDMAVLSYLLERRASKKRRHSKEMSEMYSDVDVSCLLEAIELSKKCVPSKTAFSVGAILYDRKGNRVTSGYSRETSLPVHAEEVALQKASGSETKGGTLYCSLEPCGRRLSGRRSCADQIIDAGIRTVWFALREPPVFVTPSGERKLKKAGIQVIIVEHLGSLVENINRYALLTKSYSH